MEESPQQPQAKQENLETENDSENKELISDKLTQIEFDDGSSIELAYTEKPVKLPQHLVEETGGVEGYIRKEVSWQNLTQALEKIVPFEELKKLVSLTLENKDLDPERYDSVNPSFDKLDSINSLSTFQNAISFIVLYLKDPEKSIKKHGEDHLYQSREFYKKNIGTERWEELKSLLPKVYILLRKVVDTLGDNFIEGTNLHAVDGYWSSRKEGSEEDLKKKLLMQKIFHPSLSMRDKKFWDGTTKPNNESFSAYSIENPDKELVQGEKDGEINLPEGGATLNEDAYDSFLRDKKVFLLFHRHLSLTNGGFWTPDGRTDNLDKFCIKPFFGFNLKNKAYKLYLEQGLEVLQEIYRSMPEPVDEYEYDGNKYGNKEISVSMKKYLVDQLIQGCNDLLSENISSASNSESAHPILPIIIGNPDIPDLRWCHSSYAYIPTKSGINIIEMKSN